MQETLMTLLRAQDIDLEIDKLIKAKKEYPIRIESLKKEITELEDSVQDKDSRLLQNKKSRLMIEEEITAEREVLANKEKRLLETQTNKEYTAVQHEIESAREKIDRLETENLELMTAQDTLQPELDELRSTLETMTKENSALIEELQEKFDSIETDIAALASSRDTILRKVEQRYLSVYTRLRKGRTGVAVAPVDQRKLSCSGCFKHLPPQKVVEVRRGQRMIFCESCGKILVWDDREGTV